MSEEKKELSLITPVENLEEQILNTEDIDELSDIIDLFNLNLQKRNILRNKKLNDIQDKVVDRMLQKIEEEPWEFSNDDLVKFHKTVQDTLSKSEDKLNKESLPTIQVNQQINVTSPAFNRESRSRILDAVHSILENNTLEELEVIDVEEVSEENNNEQRTL